jgi:nuclear pore complex protein Nup133
VRQTAGATDAELADRMRSTALFAVLRAAARRPALTALLPDAILVVPDAETLASRWPGLAPEQLDALLDDYNSEVQVVTDHALQDVFGRISELATIEAYDDA